jgi:valyl-tRNA synthetase
LIAEQFQGLVNLEAELAKCDKKIELACLNLEKLNKVMSQPDYQVTVPEAVQLSNEEKVGIFSSLIFTC